MIRRQGPVVGRLPFLLLLATCVAAQSINYGAFLESFDVFQARYDGSAVSTPPRTWSSSYLGLKRFLSA